MAGSFSESIGRKHSVFFLEAKRKIRRVILEEGGTYPDVTVLMEPDNKTRHIVFECEFENDYDMEE